MVVLIALWGVAGVTWLLVSAIARLTPLAIEPVVAHTMTTAQWALYVGWSLFNGYVEGYRGFQKGYVPRVVARAFWLGQHPRPLLIVLAPFFCSGLIHATRKRLITSWSLLVGIVLIVQLVRLLDQPWRGILDAGVVVGLAYGTAALLVAFTRVLAGAPIRVSPQVPDDG
ncbi:MAG: hypothetical protein JNL82_06100 [Myxococcales bacterium]|nr:hypothetical protein [Myxococcales bacterium]